MKKIVSQEINAHIEISNLIPRLENEIIQGAELAIEAIRKNGKLIIFGNGGSAADSQHIAAELVGRYKINRRGLPAIALTTDTSAITAIGNDFGYEYIFQRQLEALAQPNDLIIGISTSGNSINVIKALNFAKSKNLKTLGLSGSNGGEMSKICDLNVIVPSSDTARIQEVHIFIGHTICHIVEQEFS